MALVSYVVDRARDRRLRRLKIPAALKNRFVLVGADNSDRTKAEIEEAKRDLKPFISGSLYWTYIAFALEYIPAKLLVSGRRFFMQPPERCTNDCLVHALNYALGCPWFVEREQVVRLIQVNGTTARRRPSR